MLNRKQNHQSIYPQGKRWIKKPAVVSASYWILFLILCCHHHQDGGHQYGLCSIALELRMRVLEQKRGGGGGEPPADLYFECGFATPLLGVSNPELQSSYVFSDVLTWKCLLNLSLWRHFNDGIMWQNLFFFVLMDMFAACNNHSLIFKNVFFCKPGFQIELVRCPYLELEVHWGIFLDFWIRNIKWNIDYFEKVKMKSVTDLLSLLLFECCWIFWHAFQYIWC